MFKLQKTALPVFLIFSLKLFCQQRALMDETGIVVSSGGNFPVEGATIITNHGNRTAVTNELGKFSLKNTSADSIFVSAIGFESKTISHQQFENSKGVIFLNHRPVELSAVTITGNRGDQLSHISRIDIQMRSITNSQEVLRLVPGLFIGQHAGGGKAEQLFLRGFDLDHGTDINISVDGMPVNMVSHAHGQGYADLHFLIPELIETVNFKKGPYYADKGNLTTSGFVEFKTKDFLPNDIVKVEAGQFNSYRTVAMINLLKKKQKKDQVAFIASEYMYTNGYFDSPQRFDRINVFGKYNVKINTNNDFVFSGSSFSSKWNASGQIPERALRSGLIGFFGSIDPNEGGYTARTNLNAQLKTMLKNGNSIQNQFYYTKYDFTLYSDFTFFLRDSVNGDQIRQRERRDLFGYNGSFSHKNNERFSTDAGINLRVDKTNNSELSRTKDRIIITDRLKLGNIREVNAGTWINENVEVNQKLSANAGLRYDYFANYYFDKLANFPKQSSAGIVSPKVNMYYQVDRKNKIYFSAGKGFHSNDTRVVVETGGKKTLPAAYGLDLGILSKPWKNVLVQAALWYLKLDQEFVYVGDEGVVNPSGRSRRTGMDMSLRFQPVKWLFIDADVNYARPRSINEKQGENYLPLAPILTSTGGITYKNATGWNASLRYRYMGNRPANETNTVQAKGYFVTDGSVNFIHLKFEVGATIQNLFNVRWKETQFDTESRMRNEPSPVSEIHFTPGTPFFFKTHACLFF